MKLLIEIVFVVLVLLFSIITTILVIHKEEMWDKIEFKERKKNDKR